MIAIVIYGVIAIALAAVAGYSIISFFDASRMMSRASENLSRMDMAVSLVKANIRYVDGKALVPMGGLGGSYTILPTWMGAHDTSTSGDKYLYCPFASEDKTTADSANVTDGDGTTYQVYLTEVSGKDYVAGFSDNAFFNKDTSLRDTGILAFLVSPLDGNSTLPKCDDVELTANGNFIVSNGVVKVIQAGSISSQRNISSASKAIFYVDNDSDVTASSGDKTGRDANNPTTLDDALAFMAVYSPRVMEIHLAPGNYSPNVTDFSYSPKSMGESKLILMGDNTGNRSNVIISASSFSFPMNVELKDVNVNADVNVLTGKSLFISNDVTVDSITLKGGNLYLDNEDADLIISGANSANSGIFLFYGSKLISVADSSATSNRILFSSGVTYGINNRGSVNLVYTDVEFSNVITYGINLGSGSSLNMDFVDLASVGPRPVNGIYDDSGAISVAGTGSHVYATSCWNRTADSLFEYSSVAASAPVKQSVAVWNSGTWAAPADSAVDAYVGSRALQYSNRSDWDCN